jgi:hypothetical protein
MVSIVLKTVLSLILILIAAGIIGAVMKLWTPPKLSVANFTFRRRGENAAEAGKDFTQGLVIELKRLHFILFEEKDERGLIASTDQLGRGARVELPIPKEAGPALELEAYGLKLTSLIGAVQGWVDTPNEITGSVTQTDDGIDVFVEMRRPNDESAHWHVTSRTAGDGANELAARILLRLAAGKHPEFVGVSDDNFLVLLKALERYQVYRRLIRTAGAADEAKTSLSEAESLITPIVADARSPSVAYKLLAYIFREQGKKAQAAAALERYLSTIADRRFREDKPASAELAALQEAIKPKSTSTEPRPPIPMLRPGASIGVGNSAGTLGIFVADASGAISLLSTVSVLRGAVSDDVASPSFLDGRGPIVATVTYLDSSVAPEPLWGLARLKDGVKWTSQVANGPVIRAVLAVEDVSIGMSVSFVGRTSGLKRARVVDRSVSLKVNDGERTLDYANLWGIAPGSDDAETAVSAPGDSGAPVFTDDGRLLGLIFAGSIRRTLVAPVRPFLDAKRLVIATQ